MALFLDLAVGDRLRIAETTVTLEQKSGQRVRLRIDGPDKVQPVQPAPLTRALPSTSTPHMSAAEVSPRRMSAEPSPT